MRTETPRNGRGRAHRPVVWPEQSFGVQTIVNIPARGQADKPEHVPNGVIILNGPGLVDPLKTVLATADGIESGAAAVAVLQPDGSAVVGWSCHPAYERGQRIDVAV